ncbi:MAG: VOC family protein [Cyclobacteriaceae bacterium]|nr:VOC family protein [Cyclobacteriaceae bacterium]
MKNNILGWFEIPVSDMDRAIKFYESVLEIKFQRYKMDALDMALFPWKENTPGAPGSLVFHKDFYAPSEDRGVLIYLTSPSGDLNKDLAAIEKAGGKVVVPSKLISEDNGYMAAFLDTEGNRIALHSKT